MTSTTERRVRVRALGLVAGRLAARDVAEAWGPNAARQSARSIPGS